ncbi:MULTISPECIES: hypothetical protein [unclassified Neptuniibacter]|uniref:hypothetical protein n=1 Tax=unclassified Neptuniibacter TaxID=2630693 RepID=UPI000C3CA961|nr:MULTISPECIES: hypothetical protein [unclassified Neptuniibacter]MAY42964.1 hypothetical protein [Oceanospirillaceae bacterium]
MTSQSLEKLCDLATLAHTRIQKDFDDLDPIVGVSQNMRKNAVPADAMTIDCLRSGKRIIIILHDQYPDVLMYQFSFKEKDPKGSFKELDLADLTEQILYDWMCNYFAK